LDTQGEKTLTGECIKALNCHSGTAYSVHFDNKAFLATALEDSIIRIWALFNYTIV